jgi:type IV pilus assembly protein PilW
MNSIRAKQHGLSLISLLIALTIGVFLLAGLFNLWLQTRNTFQAQGSLAQMQDDERMALTVMANTIQSAGYYPLWENYSASSTVPPPTPLLSTLNAFPTATGFSTAGQYVSGTTLTTATGTYAAGDQIVVRFVADTGSNGPQLDCLGQSHPNLTIVTNTYSVSPASGSGQAGNLQCEVDTAKTSGATTTGTPEAVVPNVSQLTALYGVDPNGTGSVTEYLDATAVSGSSYWPHVRSVMVQLQFANPLYGQPGQTMKTFTVTRVIAVPQTTVSI